MAELFCCPKGHEWEISADGGSRTPTAIIICPICGATGFTAPSRTVPSEPLEVAKTLHFNQPPVAPNVSPVAPGSFRGKVPPILPTIPGYEVLKVLGHGGMGVVYKARQINLNRLVALKMVLAGVHASPQRLARFHLEAEAVASLQHPNIVQIYEIAEHEQCPFFSLELVEGGTLDQKLNRRPQPPEEAAGLLETLARAMHCAHLRGIVHRDLKPGNILLSYHGDLPAGEGGTFPEGTRLHDFTPKITDFGLAKRLEEESGQTQSGAIMGTPSYMAPEQALGHIRSIGPATDVYALGAILYEMLTGQPPFLGENTLETLQKVRYQEPIPPTRLQHKVPRDLATICLKCLQKEPGRRYASAEALAEDLRRFQADEPILARPVRLWERTWKWARRRPAAAALVLVSCLAVVSLVAGGLWYNSRLRAALKKAEEHFVQARGAVDKMLTEVAEEQLTDEPRMDEKKLRLLKEALSYYRKFSSEKPDDPAMQEAVAQAHRRMGDILGTLGEFGQAEEEYRQAIALLTPLATGPSATPKQRQQLGYCYNWLGEALRNINSYQKATAAYLQARDLQQGLVAEFPEDPGYQQQLARTLYNLGILLGDDFKPAEAKDNFRRSIAILEKLLAGHPDNLLYKQEMARSYLNLGNVQSNLGEHPAAEQSYQRALGHFQGLVDQAASNPDYRYELAVCRNSLGNLLRVMNSYSEANQAHRESEADLKRLVADFPKRPKIRSELANTYNSLGVLQALHPKSQAPDLAWNQAFNFYQDLVSERPDVPDYQVGLAKVLGNRGWYRMNSIRSERFPAFAAFAIPPGDWASLGRIGSRLGLEHRRGELDKAHSELQQGIAHLERVLKTSHKPDYLVTLCNQYVNLADVLVLQNLFARGDQPAENSYCAARLLAQVVPGVEKNTYFSTPRREELAVKYAGRAMARLAEAVDQGYKDFDQLKQDPAFQPLWERADFQLLLKRNSKAPLR